VISDPDDIPLAEVARLSRSAPGCARSSLTTLQTGCKSARERTGAWQDGCIKLQHLVAGGR
jgi:hypothetical protein